MCECVSNRAEGKMCMHANVWYVYAQRQKDLLTNIYSSACASLCVCVWCVRVSGTVCVCVCVRVYVFLEI